MKFSTRVPGLLSALALAAAAFLSQAQAALLSINLAPAANVAIGGVVNVDIVVSGLPQAIGGYQFELNYDTSRMLFSSYVADPDSKMGDVLNPAVDLSFGDSGFLVDFNMLSGFFDGADEATLALLQGTGFRLGTASFIAGPASGFASFGLTNYALSNYEGTATLADVSASDARLCVIPVGATACDNNVPEPTTGLLLAAALGGLVVATRRKQLAV